MLDYKNRMNDAWDKIPVQHQKQILEEMEHKAYQQDFQNYDDSCNVIEVLVDAIIACVKVIAKHL
ncbi:MAG: hypothetical protein ACI3T9_04475 [Romboutsia timonensis]